MELIEIAVSQGRKSLSEYESKRILSDYGIPVVEEKLAQNEPDFLSAVKSIGFPLAIKACAPEIAHKTDLDLIKLDIRTEQEAKTAFYWMMERIGAFQDAGVLVQRMAKGKREFMAGMTRDQQFGPCVMFGIGGILTEALDDVSFRVAPLERSDASEMIQEIRGNKLLGPYRGMLPVNLICLEDILLNLGRLGLENDRIQEVDLNPLIICENMPVAVDALIVIN